MTKEDFTAEILFYDKGIEESLSKMSNEQKQTFFRLFKDKCSILLKELLEEKYRVDCGSDSGKNVTVRMMNNGE